MTPKVIAVMHIASDKLLYAGISIAAAAEKLKPGTAFAKHAYRDVAIESARSACHRFRERGYSELPPHKLPRNRHVTKQP